MPLHIIRQDITKCKVDAIVNAANESLLGGGGVDGAIHRAAGPKLLEECRALGGCRTGKAKITRGYDLPARYVIHTVGPIYEDGRHGEKTLLESCYKESLALAKEFKCESVAFPLISAGIYGYPKRDALRVATDVISSFLLENEECDMTVYIVVFDKASFKISEHLFSDITEFIDDSYVNDYDEVSPRHLERIDTHVLCSDISCDFSRLPYPEDDSDFEPEPPKTQSDQGSAKDKALDEYLKRMDGSFAEKLFALIDERGITDVECYKRANVSKKTFSKIKCNPATYKPSKQTAVAFAIALKLDLEQTQELLAAAGMTLSRSFTFDKIIRYFIQKKNYNIFEINEALFNFDQTLLGC